MIRKFELSSNISYSLYFFYIVTLYIIIYYIRYSKLYIWSNKRLSFYCNYYGSCFVRYFAEFKKSWSACKKFFFLFTEGVIAFELAWMLPLLLIIQSFQTLKERTKHWDAMSTKMHTLDTSVFVFNRGRQEWEAFGTFMRSTKQTWCPENKLDPKNLFAPLRRFDGICCMRQRIGILPNHCRNVPFL